MTLVCKGLDMMCGCTPTTRVVAVCIQRKMDRSGVNFLLSGTHEPASWFSIWAIYMCGVLRFADAPFLQNVTDKQGLDDLLATSMYVLMGLTG